MLRRLIIILMFFSSVVFSSEHGIYLQLIKNSDQNLTETIRAIANNLKSAGFKILAVRDVATPDIVREKPEQQCGFTAKEVLFTSDEYVNFLTNYGSKYITAAMLRAAVYQTPHGTQVNIVDPETINRIVFNDLYDNDEEAKYNEVINKTKMFRTKIIDAVHALGSGSTVNKPMPPVRSDEDLAESSKDMFMMVGHMTFFTDEDQFPIIYKKKARDVQSQIPELISKIKSNIQTEKPGNDDIEYRLTKSPDVLKWKTVAEIYSADKSAAILGITRPRTEGLSMDIAGASRETAENKCPGIDHAGAFPIEVVIYQEGENLIVRTPREMFRMDMFFWDAGMKAFMNHMNMPKLLDESLKHAMFRIK